MNYSQGYIAYIIILAYMKYYKAIFPIIDML